MSDRQPYVPGAPSATRARLFTFPNIEERQHPVHGHIVQTVVSRDAVCPDCHNDGRVELAHTERMVIPCPRCVLGSLIDERTRQHVAGDPTGPEGQLIGRTYWQRIENPASVRYEGGRTILWDPCDGCRQDGVQSMLEPGNVCSRCVDRATRTRVVHMPLDTSTAREGLRAAADALSTAINPDAQEPRP